MTAIKLTAFIGEQPRITPHLLPDSAARSATNVRLEDGALTPIHAPVGETTLGGDDQLTVYKHGSDWLSWDSVVNAAPGPVATDRLYYTGDGVPKMRVGGTVYDLAVPRPTGVPTATPDGAGTGDEVTMTYCYTWVTDFGEESEPSPASAPFAWQPGDTVTISNIDAVPSGRAISKQRFYRSQTGQSGTNFYFIAERAAANTDFDDDVPIDEFAEPLPSADWNAPPDGLTGLVAMPNGMMAGFVGRDLYLCEPYRPHAWPEKYVITTAAPIVALGSIGTSLVITTTAHPEFATGSHPSTMKAAKIEVNLPCVSARGLVDLGFAIAYPSHQGLVAIDAAGTPRVVTGNLFSRDTWQRLSPATMLGGQHLGRYVAFYDTVDSHGVALQGALFIDPGESPFLMRTDTVAAAVFYDVPTGGLFYLAPGTRDVHRLDAPDGAPARMYWRSKTFRFSNPINFGAILVDSTVALSGSEATAQQAAIDAIIAANDARIAAGSTGGELNDGAFNVYALNGDALTVLPTLSGVLTVGVYADGTRVAQIQQTNRVMRLPAGFTSRDWEIDVAGDLPVTQVLIGRTVDDLKGVP